MNLFRKKAVSVADNEVFVTLLRVAKEDSAIRSQLGGILAQPPFHRKSLLNALIAEMKMNSAPTDFVNAIACLLDDAVAARAKELIGEWSANV